ncbi:MAG: helix-turn-helix transcriptional regulator [Pseudaminobacter sp.]|nr:helix-turn-helix transcriptional regulator [Pseudaminobacter sp.]
MTRKYIPVAEAAAEWFKDPEFVKEYDALEEEFALAAALIDARSKANLTQEQVAERMNTSQSYVAKLEGSRISPTMKALRRYADATGTKLRFSFVRAPEEKLKRRVEDTAPPR